MAKVSPVQAPMTIDNLLINLAVTKNIKTWARRILAQAKENVKLSLLGGSMLLDLLILEPTMTVSSKQQVLEVNF